MPPEKDASSSQASRRCASAAFLFDGILMTSSAPDAERACWPPETQCTVKVIQILGKYPLSEIASLREQRIESNVTPTLPRASFSLISSVLVAYVKDIGIFTPDPFTGNDTFA